MTIVAWILIGSFAGVLSRIAMPIRNDAGNKTAILIGSGGALFGGLAAIFFTKGSLTVFDPYCATRGAAGALYPSSSTAAWPRALRCRMSYSRSADLPFRGDRTRCPSSTSNRRKEYDALPRLTLHQSARP